jgi:indolepyruvate ferredoxin oxidoreductase beta subunit
MAQRGGAVLAHLRLSSEAIAGDLVPRGGADLIISMEPLESLRYLAWLSLGGALVTAAEPVLNIPDYPDLAEVHAAVKRLPKHSLVDAAVLAKKFIGSSLKNAFALNQWVGPGNPSAWRGDKLFS